MSVEKTNKRIFVAGHKGLVGSALVRVLKRCGHSNILVRDRKELNLVDRNQVRDFFNKERPEWVFLSAAKVGGILGNNNFPADFLLENLQIQNNILEAAKDFKVKKLLFLGSSCIYPKECPTPIKEEYLLTSSLESTNEAYSIAKISGLKLAAAINRQYGTNFISVMPCNLYGLNDNYHPKNAHALPMLLRRFHEAKVNKDSEVTVWGSGKPRREFLFADDLADACLYLMNNIEARDVGEIINIGTGVDLSITELAQKIAKIVDYKGEVRYDLSKPDGTFRKVLNVEKIKSLGWSSKTSLDDGLMSTYQDFLTNDNLRKG